ncbi:MAG: hypothetical protein OXC37_00755 [Bdellovibrionaceae bacterium]|nr:hypothetical protein [Pseudobdellovibrionaceae bacterium]
MNYFKFFICIFIFFSSQISAVGINDSLYQTLQVKPNFSNKVVELDGVSMTLESETEASYSFNENEFKFCCDREYTSENFFDMSKAESQRIVISLLDDSDPSVIVPEPTGGQR